VLDISVTRIENLRAGRFPLLPDGLLARRAARLTGSGPVIGSASAGSIVGVFSVGAVSSTGGSGEGEVGMILCVLYCMWRDRFKHAGW
jgi:hypothetical protein